MAKKILITGGAGFIGSNFTRYVVERQLFDDILVFDKLTYAGNKANIGDLLKSGRVRFVKGDIANKKFIFKLFRKERPDFVVNFAAETHVDRSIAEPSIFVMTNVVGTQNLLEASREIGVERYHQISTDEVYGDLGDKTGNTGKADFFTEKTPLNPTSPYAASKAASDMLVMSFVKTYAFPATISRCSNNYGPYQFPEKLIPYFFMLATQNKPLPIYGDGKNVRDWLFVLDHCEAVALILQKSKIGEIYNIGGHFERTNLEIADEILKFLKKPLTLKTFVKDRLAHDRRYAIDASKIEKELGWKPRYSFKEGIEETFAWYKNNKDWLRTAV